MSITNLHINLTQSPSQQHLNYLQNLPNHQKSKVLAALAGHEDQIKSFPLDLNIDRSGRVPTKEELDIAAEDCYESIRKREKAESNIINLAEAVAVRAIDEGSGQQDAAEELIFLGARSIKGEHCKNHPNYKSPCRVAARVHRQFAEAIGDLEDALAEPTYSDKAKFALGKLFSVYPKQYAVLRMLTSPTNLTTNELQEELGEMWCHDYEDYEDCDCWDVSGKSWQRHTKGCGLYAL